MSIQLLQFTRKGDAFFTKMKSLDLKFSSKPKKSQLWKKAILHFTLCFVTGFFSGFAPATTSSLFTSHHQIITATVQNPPQFSADGNSPPVVFVDRSLAAEIQAPNRSTVAVDFKPRRQLIIITTTRPNDELQNAQLRRLGQTLRRAPPPVLWVVVGRRSDAAATAEVLRGTRVMYRHLTYKENFTHGAAELHHQRNVALSHIEFHRLAGIVHFAGLSNVYELEFFDEIRQIESFGAWPVGMVASNTKRVVADGPVCHSSKVVGWFSKDLSTELTNAVTVNDAEINVRPAKINVSGFAFNSSILWDPERWGRPTSLPDTSQDSFKFVEDVMLEDESKLKGIPENCSRIMVWNLYIPSPIYKNYNQR